LTIADDDVVVEPQRLTAMTARIEVSWYFSNGRLCSANEVQQVRVDVWDDGFLIAEPVSPCDDGYLDVRSLPSGDYHLELSGLEGPSQNPTFGGALDVSLEKGDVRQIDVSLDPL
jgi:hypothetical protein